MNIVMFTPATQSSAIGRMAILLTQVLIRHMHHVTLVRTESESLLESEAHDVGVNLYPWNDFEVVSDIIKQADMVVYQIGNYYDFHKGGIFWLKKVSGLVCLHDFYLADLFLGWAQENLEEAKSILKYWYGENIANQFFTFSNNEAFIKVTSKQSPMTEWICSMAEAVIIHSSWGEERVINSCPGPVRKAALAYNIFPHLKLNSKKYQKSLKNKSFQILTIGHINFNKRVESVIQAIAQSSIPKNTVIYRLAGKIQPEQVISLSTLARSLGVRLVISGEVDNLSLARMISESQVISCLRWPVLEGASASAIEAMLYGKPTVVTDAGFYSELPDHLVFKVSAKNEINDVSAVLEYLFTHSEMAHQVGKKAQVWASRTFTAENYCQTLMMISKDIIKSKINVNAIQHFSNLLNQWGATSDFLNMEALSKPIKIFESPMFNIQKFPKQKKILVFLHIEKSAGSSFRTQFYHLYGMEKVFWHDIDSPSLQFERDKILERDIIVMGGHRLFSFYPKDFAEFYFMALLREPISRILSLYNYIVSLIKNNYPKPDESPLVVEEKFDINSFNDTIKYSSYFRDLVENRQCRYLSGSTSAKETIKHIENHPFLIGTQENLSEYMGVCKKLFKWPKIELPCTNYGIQGYQDTLQPDSESISIMHSLTSEDKIIYDYVAAKKVVYNSVQWKQIKVFQTGPK